MALKFIKYFVICVCLFFCVAVIMAEDKTQTQAKPTVPDIPGLTINDDHPNGCVDCHKNYPEYKMDVRFSTLIKKWAKDGADKELVEIAKATKPKNIEITGKHPDISELIKEKGTKVPTVCLGCHSKSSDVASSFSKMIHLVHLTTEKNFTGDENHFLMNYKGFCTNCHAMDKETGRISLKTGSEQK